MDGSLRAGNLRRSLNAIVVVIVAVPSSLFTRQAGHSIDSQVVPVLGTPPTITKISTDFQNSYTGTLGKKSAIK